MKAWPKTYIGKLKKDSIENILFDDFNFLPKYKPAIKKTIPQAKSINKVIFVNLAKTIINDAITPNIKLNKIFFSIMEIKLNI